MGELRQRHPSLRISKVKALQKGDLLVVGDSPRDAVILQSEPKMKAALGKNVRVSLPKAYQITKQQNKGLVVKRVPTDLTDVEFKEFLDLNKISYAKAERYKSKRDGRILPMFQLEIRDPSVFMVGTGPEICQMVEQKKSLSRMENVSKILLSRMDHKLKKSLSRI